MRLAAVTILLAVLLVQAAPVASQTRAAAEEASEMQRLDRLQALAEIWSTLALHHPFLLHRDIDWDHALIEAIPFVERARTGEDFVEALQRTIFRRLDDPLSYARTIEQGHPVATASSASFAARKIAPGVGYLVVPDPRQTFAPDFHRRVKTAVDALGSLELLIVDTRWNTPDVPSYAGQWLGLWADSASISNPWVSVLRWGPEHFAEWRVEPGRLLAPLGSRVGTPTVFLTNLLSYPALEPALDVLQFRRDIAVILEQTGPLPDRWYVLTFGEVRVRIQSPMLVSRTGRLGSGPDRVVSKAGPLDVSFFRGVLQEHANRSNLSASLFDYTVRRRQPDTTAVSSLTREQRIAGLIKIWMNIGRFQAYLEYADIKWDRLLPVWIPRVESAVNTRDYFLTLRQLTARLNDSHVNVHHPSVTESPWSIPLLLMRVQDRVLVVKTDSTQIAGVPLEIGDEVVAIDGKSVAQVEEHWRAQRSASSAGSHFRNVWEYGLALRGEKNAPVVLTIAASDGTRSEVSLHRTVHWLSMFRDAPFWYGIARVFPNNTGYISPYAIRNRVQFDSAFAMVKGTDGIVLDLRQRAGPDLSEGFDLLPALLEAFVDRPVWQRKGRTPLLNMHRSPPTHAWTEKSTVHVPSKSRRGVFGGPLVVLINSRQQSAGEEIPLVLKAANRATFVGSPTTGTNGGSPEFSIVGGGRMTFTFERVENNDGSRFHGIGIVPDVVVTPTIQGIRAGRDEVLDTALAVIRSLRRTSTAR